MMDPNRLKELGLLPLWRARSDTAIDQSPSLTEITPTDFEVQDTENDQNDDRLTRISEMNWEQLKQAVAACAACPLYQARKHTVFGVGDVTARWLFIGEGPGGREDELGEPFVGQAGKLLDNMLLAIGLKRDQFVYIANIVKCRPPGNRNPQHTEAEQCRPYLLRQIALVQPRLIVALGKVAAQNLLATGDSIASLRGKLHDFVGIPLIVTYHPAYLLRALADKAKAWEDLCLAKATMQALQTPERPNP